MDNAYERMKLVSDKRKSEIAFRKEQYNKASKERLAKILEKKQLTCSIGAISQFENFFGHLWGDKKPRKTLTQDELRWRNIWDTVRTNILNNGNNQIRNTHNELSQYTITWNRYNLEFNIKDAENNETE